MSIAQSFALFFLHRGRPLRRAQRRVRLAGPALAKLLAALVLALQCALAGSAVICRADSFEGMEAHKARAETVLAGIRNTGDIRSAAIYVEYDPAQDVLYYHSNFITPPGHDEVTGQPFRPTKVKGSPVADPRFADLAIIFRNIVGEKEPDPDTLAALGDALRDKVRLFMDVSVFDAAGVPRVNVGEARNIQIVNTTLRPTSSWIGSSRPAQPPWLHEPGKRAIADVLHEDGLREGILGAAEPLPTRTPPPSIIAKIRGCCLYGVPPHLIGQIGEKLRARRIRPQELKVASLFVDSETDRAFGQSPALRAARLKGDASALRTEADLARMFDTARGGMLVLLGHVEGRDYVVRSNNTDVLLSVPIERVRAMAAERGITLIDIGCLTTAALERETMGLGVSTEYNSVLAVNRLNTVLHRARTLEDLLVGLSSNDLKVVVDDSFVVDGRQTTRGSIFARVRDQSRVAWARVATVVWTDPLSWYARLGRSIKGLWSGR